MENVREVWGFATSGELIFGNHGVQKIGKIVKRLKGKKALVITDPFIKGAGLLSLIEGPLKEESISFRVYDQGEPEPSRDASDIADSIQQLVGRCR